MFNLGWSYLNGDGVRTGYAQAEYWLRLSAKDGNADAQSNLGWMYEHGLGVRQSDVKAAEWYRKAAEQGQSYSQYLLGKLYEAGRGVVRDKGRRPGLVPEGRRGRSRAGPGRGPAG